MSHGPGLDAALLEATTQLLQVYAAAVLIDQEASRNLAVFAAACGCGATQLSEIIASWVPPIAGAPHQVE